MNPSSPHAPPEGATPAAGRPRALNALAIDLEPATSELIALWLAGEGWPVNLEPGPGDAVSMILVEMAFPRHTERQRLRALAEVWPVPVIVLSPTFFADVPSRGELARQLGVAAVLATPLKRDAFVAAVRGVLDRRG